MGSSDSTSEFMPHGHCFYWQEDILALHVGSDVLIAIAYFSIPFALLYLAKKRPDLVMVELYVFFAAFILACGISHLINSWNFWNADYWLSGWAKGITALISVVTAIRLWTWMPKILGWPSPILLKQKNSELKEQISLRHEAETQLEEAFEHSPIGKALVALDGSWIKVNDSLCQMLGYSEAEMMNTTFQDLTYIDDLEDDVNKVSELMAGRSDSYQMEKRYKHKSGHLVWALLSVTLVRNEDFTPRYFISQILDITYRKLSEEELRRTKAELETRVEDRTRDIERVNRQLEDKNIELKELSTTDPMTKLYNRRVFTEKIEELVYDAKRYGYEFCIMIIDIDHFKTINDTHGHMFGDDVICKVSDILKNTLRKTDVVSRFGGDEFCVLLPHTSLRRAPLIAEKFCESISSEKFEAENGEVFTVTCSVGVAEFSDDVNKSKDILAIADKALYVAKERGRNCVAVGNLAAMRDGNAPTENSV